MVRMGGAGGMPGYTTFPAGARLVGGGDLTLEVPAANQIIRQVGASAIERAQSTGLVVLTQLFSDTLTSLSGLAGQVLLTGILRQAEQAGDPAAPAVNQVLVYAKDVAGKTQVAARFNTGAVQAMATEP